MCQFSIGGLYQFTSGGDKGRSIGKIIEEGLLLRGIKPVESARQLVARARLQAGLDDEGATRMAVEETHAQRNA